MLDLLQSLFFIELFFASFIFCSHFKRQASFVRTLFLAVFSILFSSISMFFHHPFTGLAADLISLGYYLIVFCCFSFTIYSLYQMSLLELVVVSVLSYAAQHLGYDFWMLFVMAARLSFNRETAFSPEFLFMQAAAYLISYLFLYFAIGRSFKLDSMKVKSHMQWVFASLTLLCIALAFSLFFIREDAGPLRFNLFFYDLICTLFGIVTIYLIAKRDDLETSLSMMQQNWALRQEHYETTKKSLELINIKCHDIRKTISLLYSREHPVNDPDDLMLREIQESIQIYDAIYHTGNDALDVILTEKSFLCQKDHIIFTCIADGPAISFMTSMDIYALFGNILDNAIEAVQHIPVSDSENRRVIDFSMKQNGKLIFIQEQNFYDGTRRIENGLPATRKADTNNHGFGMKSIRFLVNKYHGTMSFHLDDEMFTLNILIPVPEE